MINETIVNRTPETFGQKAERQRLEAEAKARIDSDAMGEAVPTEAEIAQAENEGLRVQYAGNAIPVSELPEGAVPDNIEEIDSTFHVLPIPPVPSEAWQFIKEAQGGNPDTVIVGKASLTRDPDLKIFKDQVVAAFKHMGVDTKKFFGV
jgi:hypothetical protein